MDNVKTGKAAIVKLDDKRVAAYRDEAGTLHFVFMHSFGLPSYLE